MKELMLVEIELKALNWGILILMAGLTELKPLVLFPSPTLQRCSWSVSESS